MKKIKLINLLMVCMLFMPAMTVDARKNDKIKVNVIPAELRQRGDQLNVNMLIDLDKLSIASKRGMILTPVLEGEQGQRVLMSPILINGKNRQKSYQRSLALGNQEPVVMPSYVIVKTRKNKENIVQYSQVLPFEPWMANADVKVMADLCGCGKVEPLPVQVDLTRRMAYEMVPVVAFVQPVAEVVKARSKQWDVFLDFPVNKSVILPDYMNNRSEIEKIESMLKEIHGDKNIMVNRIQIIGYASPEGSLAINERLSRERAQAFKKYISSAMEFPADVYSVEYAGENWDGLVTMLEASTMKDKDALLAIIKTTDDINLRKEKLKQLDKGVPYRQMLTEIYPKLRKVICRVNYNVKNFSVDEGKEVIKIHPEHLSLNEMYLIANTYPVGSQPFISVFETAVQVFPNDEVANLNAAAIALSRDDLPAAAMYLDKADTTAPEYANNWGVYYMMTGDVEKAREVLNKAATVGNETARTNLQEIQKKMDADK